jgi:antitoxin VapB
MALQIANPSVIEKAERLARETGMTKTAVVDRALDCLALTLSSRHLDRQIESILAQLDRIPDRTDAYEPLGWDASGLPK